MFLFFVNDLPFVNLWDILANLNILQIGLDIYKISVSLAEL